MSMPFFTHQCTTLLYILLLLRLQPQPQCPLLQISEQQVTHKLSSARANLKPYARICVV
jgi:hypothetical protein